MVIAAVAYVSTVLRGFKMGDKDERLLAIGITGGLLFLYPWKALTFEFSSTSMLSSAKAILFLFELPTADYILGLFSLLTASEAKCRLE